MVFYDYDDDVTSRRTLRGMGIIEAEDEQKNWLQSFFWTRCDESNSSSNNNKPHQFLLATLKYVIQLNKKWKHNEEIFLNYKICIYESTFLIWHHFFGYGLFVFFFSFFIVVIIVVIGRIPFVILVVFFYHIINLCLFNLNLTSTKCLCRHF